MSAAQHDQPQAPAVTPEARQFFKRAATYVVADGATLAQLLNDGYALLSSALAVFELTTPETDADFAVWHLLEQATAVISAADDLAEMAERSARIGGAA